MVSAEQCKEDIAKKYLDQFKSELNFFEKAMILPISNKMKEILKSDKKIDAEKFSDLEDLWFRRKVLWVKFWNKELFEGLVNKTFKFLKEQQEKILEAQTQGKLEDLLASVINWKLDDLNQSVSQNWTPQANQWDNQQVQPPVWDNQWWASENQSSWWDNPDHQETSHEWDSNNHSIEAWVWAAVVWAWSYRAWVAQIESRLGLEHVDVPEHFDKDRTKKMLSGLADQMEDRMKWWLKLNKVQKYTYEKSIKNFRKAAESLDNQTAEAFKVWQKIGDKLPPQYLEHLNINHNVLSLIDALPDEELAKIIGKDEQAIVKFMEKKGITISTDFAKSLKLAKNVQEIKQITNVARNGRKLANFVKGVKWMGMITFLFMGFDVWNYFDASKEAELVKKLNEVRWEVLQDEATAQLLIWVGWVLAEALALRWVCAAGWSVAWPIWTAVGIIVGVIIWAASMLTSSYNSKKEFYAQNRHDFINKKRAEVKQSVVQLFESDRLWMDEGMKESIKDARWPNSEVNTMEDAWEALIYQEEVSEGWYNFLSWYYSSWDSEEDFLSKLSQEDKETYNQEKSQMEEIINIRMEYVKTHISTDQSSESYKALKKAIEDKKWLKYVEQILADSKLYQYLKSEDENPYIENYKQLDIAWYKEAYKNKLSSEYPQEFKIFEQLKEENPILLDEICRGTLASKNTIW